MEEKGRKEMLLSSFHPAFKRRRNHLNLSWLKPNGVVSGVRKWENVENMSGASRNSSGLDENSQSLDNETNLQTSDKQDHQSLSSRGLVNSNGLGDSLVIPKRPRAATRRKKIDILNSSKRSTGSSTSNDKTRTDVPSSKSPISIFPSPRSLNGDHKNLLDNKQISCLSRDDTVPKIKDEKEKRSTKVQPRKRKRFEVERKIHEEKEKLIDDEKLSGAPVEDDEDNLEQNAARMLSSRFDPSCTGFSGKKMALSLKSAKGRSPLKQFNGSFKGLCSETSSVSAAGRVLRPRNRNSKGFARKRRHFYEVCSKDMDPYSLIKQRIRVFWPLDQCWYFGLVKDYDPASKLHHVKYDDRDEEWIDLQNERFKLLLFPSEVSRSLNSHNLGLELKQKTNQNDNDIIDDNCIGNFMETEPIISWLARSSGSLRSSPERVLKKRRAHLLNNLGPSTLSRKMNMNAEPSTITAPKSNSSSVVPGNSSLDGEIAGASLLNRITCSDERKLSFVYTRRRFRKRSGVLDDMPSQVSSCSSSAGSFHTLASVMASVTTLEQCCLTITNIGQKQISLKLLLSPQCVRDLSSALRTCWLSHADYGVHFGKLIQISPMVHMKIIFVDNVLGLRVVSFEGCFQWVWGIVSLIISAFHDHNHKKLADLLLPSTSIGFNVSGLHDRRRHIVFALHSFLQLDKSRWEYLEHRLKHHCLKITGLPVDSCLNSNLKNLSSSCEMLSTMSDPDSDEDLSGRLCSSMNLLLCSFQRKNKKLPPYAFSFAESSYLSLGFHFKLLIQRNMSSLKPKSPSALASKELAEIDVKSIDDGCLPIENSPDRGPEMMLENLGCSLAASSSGWLDDSHPKGELDASSVSSDGDQMKTNYRSVSSGGKITGISMDLSDLRYECSEKIEKLQMLPSSWMGDKKYSSSSPDNDFPPEKRENGCDSCLNGTSIRTQSYDQVKEQSNEDVQAACHASDLAWEMNAPPVNVSKATAPRSIWHHNRPNSISPSSCQRSRLWSEDFIWDSFASGSRKPRSQVSYSLSFGNREIGSRPRSHNRKARPFKKIRIDHEKCMPHALGGFHTYFASRICDANVLVTSGDRGWRECGAHVVLDSDDQKGCRISVKFSGVTRYDHKVQQSLQPGSTNRFTHAMMWKGGKDWTLEFTDRNQWSLFKELHEECYNRNIRSASVKNIPTPGVRPIEDAYDGSSEVPFVRSSPKYFQQVGTEIDMALDPSCVLYDMDSEDEEWVSEFRLSLDDLGSNGSAEVTDDVFEGIMDMFEKFAYDRECDEFTNDEIEEFMADCWPLNIIKAIYEHWRLKRQKKGLPLIRQFQPPLWERYQQQLKQWESAISKMHNPSDGSQDKGRLIEKPAMFAFCLRPRGLEVPNKFSKQRSHKKFIYSGHHNSFAKEQDGLHAFDRKLNGTSAGGEKDLVIAIPTYESSDSFHSRHASSSFSPMDSRRMGFLLTNDASERNHFPVLYRNNSKKTGLLASPRDLQMLPSHNQKVRRNSSSRWSSDMSEWPSRMDSHLDESHRHRADIDEFRLRDASSAAQHARNMAKLKREKSHRLMHKANLALHKATVALITAEAIKASQKDLTGDG